MKGNEKNEKENENDIACCEFSSVEKERKDKI